MSDRDPLDQRLGGESNESKEIIPTIEAPSTTIPDGKPAQEVETLFWRLVILANIALFGVAVGVMFLLFEAAFQIGGLLIAIGAIAGLGGYVRYRRFKRSRIDQ